MTFRILDSSTLDIVSLEFKSITFAMEQITYANTLNRTIDRMSLFTIKEKERSSSTDEKFEISWG